MENSEIKAKVLKALDEINLPYSKNEDDLNFIQVHFEKQYKFPDQPIKDVYSVAFFLEFDPGFGETLLYTAIVDSFTYEIDYIITNHSYVRIGYKDGIAYKLKTDK